MIASALVSERALDGKHALKTLRMRQAVREAMTTRGIAHAEIDRRVSSLTLGNEIVFSAAGAVIEIEPCGCVHLYEPDCGCGNSLVQCE